MCRNIRTLYNFEPPVSDAEIEAAALQFVRKITGFSRPAQANQAAFTHAVNDIARASRILLDSLSTSAAPRDRATEAARLKAASTRRFGT